MVEARSHASSTVTECRTIAGSSPTIVFLHEGLGCMAMWHDFPDRVADAVGLGAFVYSRAGYGASEPIALPRSPRFMHEEAFEKLPALLASHGIERPILVGHSDGASIALLYASRAPVAKVVVLAPHLFVEPLSVESIARAKVAYETGDLRNRLARYHGANVDIAFRGWNDVWLSAEFERTFHLEDDVARIEAPVLAIQGRQDEYGTLAQMERIATRGQVARIVLEDCKHAPHRDRPIETLEAIARFVRGGP
jgi:pimeloyl-ACP methyl ester carboxylesterase